METLVLFSHVKSRLRAATASWPGYSVKSRQRRRARSHLPLLKDDTEACRKGLLRFGHESDKGFTDLAKGISLLSRRLSDLRAKAEQLDLMLQDKDEEHAISSAYLLYKNAVDLVHASLGIAVSEQEQMNQIGLSLLKACEARILFGRNHLMLRILATNTRMEAVRQDAEGKSIFLNIAASIDDIDRKIEKSTEDAFEQIESIIAEASSQRDQLTGLEQTLHAAAQRSIDRIKKELAALKTSLEPCAGHCQRMKALIAEASSRTLPVISSLQHQDIVRQQLEHVAAGFADLNQHLVRGDASHPEAEPLEFAYIHQAAAVQQAHLRASREEISAASDQVLAGLHGLVDAGDPLVEEFANLERTAMDAFRESHIGVIFQTEIKQLAKIADQSEAANNKSSHLVECIESLVQVFSKEISSHELDVKLVALNAQIASARLATADALNRLAEETGAVANSNALVTQKLIKELQQSLDRLQSMKQSAIGFVSIVAQEKNDLDRSVDVVGDKLNRLGERVQAASSWVTQQFETAHRENAALLENFNFNALIERSYTPAERVCERLLAETALFAADTCNDAAAAKLESHRGRYTMQKENATHTAVTRNVVVNTDAENEIELFSEADPSEQANGAAPTLTAPKAIEALLPANEVSAATEINASDKLQEAAPPADKGDLGDGIELF